MTANSVLSDEDIDNILRLMSSEQPSEFLHADSSGEKRQKLSPLSDAEVQALCDELKLSVTSGASERPQIDHQMCTCCGRKSNAPPLQAEDSVKVVLCDCGRELRYAPCRWKPGLPGKEMSSLSDNCCLRARLSGCSRSLMDELSRFREEISAGSQPDAAIPTVVAVPLNISWQPVGKAIHGVARKISPYEITFEASSSPAHLWLLDFSENLRLHTQLVVKPIIHQTKEQSPTRIHGIFVGT